MALIHSDPSALQPDIELQFLPLVFDHDYGASSKAHGFTISTGPVRVSSRGWVKLRSDNAKDPPQILCNLLSSDDDWVLMCKAIEIGRNVAGQWGLKSIVRKSWNRAWM